MPLRIGITSSLRRNDALGPEAEAFRHALALERAGAEPVILRRGFATATAMQEKNLKGLLFSGGGDVSPERYGGNAEVNDGRVDPIRDESELALIHTAYLARMPLLCVCRGLQVANVAFGGTLIEDLPTELGDRYSIRHHQVHECGEAPNAYTHEVFVVPNTSFAELVGTTSFWTNSVHHQAVRRLAPLFRPAATSSDGVVEAIEAKDDGPFFLGVQWHPEALPDGDPTSQKIYGAFIATCARALRT